jgi:AcrR family transcriptional regulator
VSQGRGRIDKREAMLDAAFQVFAARGYASATVDAIAAAAGVAKPTIYNHLGGKENLFRAVMARTAAESSARTRALLDAFPAEPADLYAELLVLARGLADCFCDPRSATVRRLLHAEIVRFPDLFDVVRTQAADTFLDGLAARLAVLAGAGRLRVADPLRAAHQFVSLIIEELPALSGLGTRPVDPAALDRVVTAGVDTFLRAFRVDRDR